MIGFFVSNLRDDNATANDDINDTVTRLAGESGLGYPFRLIRRTLGQQTNDDEQRQAHDLQTDRYMTQPCLLLFHFIYVRSFFPFVFYNHYYQIYYGGATQPTPPKDDGPRFVSLGYLVGERCCWK
jgi:hypothetical protein